MGFQYVSVEEAMALGGLRMVVVGAVPSPWGEAAKGIFHIKGIEWVAVRLDHRNETLAKWAGQRSGPVAIFDSERPRAGWAEILLLAERLAPAPSLLPVSPEERALVFGLGHEILGEQGLCWSRRLQLVHAGMQNAGGFHIRVARYLADKYGYSSELGDASRTRVVELLGMLAARLRAQREAEHRYYIADRLTAVDVYSAAALGLFKPLPPEHCAMDPNTRAAFETLDEQTQGALDPILLEHRDMMYAEHLELPLAL